MHILKTLIGLPTDKPKDMSFEIKPKIDNQNIITMDMSSFRNSVVVSQQVRAAKSIAEHLPVSFS